ncbi:T9SS type A sorting domain-containing protein, partial [Bacteroidales bacterium OttesenSCG-928-M11]|nr:T9SS type A sorting domain-containing protein [Bacteroidales bacterium OttesenSCG-928-M11]
TNAQMLNDNNSWNVLTYPSGLDQYKRTFQVCLDGDSIVGEYSYKKVFSDQAEQSGVKKYEGLIREQGEKVYLIPNYSEEEYLLYDFSLTEGMEFECVDAWSPNTELFYVKEVDYIKLGDKEKKRIRLASYGSWGEIIWIEDVGSLCSPLYPCGPLAPGAIHELLCSYQGDELIYKNPDYSECYYDYSVLKETIVDDDYSVSPNPVEDVLVVSGNDISQVDIFDVSGKKVYAQPDGKEINMTSFPKGTYIINVYDSKDVVRSFKVIKK